jgi:hypothetical protein
MKFTRLILSCLCVLLCQATFAAPSRPNVLFPAVDDLTPAHPELLDLLASRPVANGWKLKAPPNSSPRTVPRPSAERC